eukprot:UN01800
MGYSINKAEGDKENWHGHISAVTVAPQFRRLKLASRLMDDMEHITIHQHNAYFIDLFVRKGKP